MLRIFLPLYIILAVFFVGFMSAVETLPDVLLSDAITKTDRTMSSGSAYLIEQELEGLSPTEQKAKIAALQAYFGYPIQILEADNTLLDADTWHSLMETGFYSADDEDVDYNIHKLNGSNRAILLMFSDSLAISDHREAQGTLHLIQSHLADYPQADWVVEISELQSHFSTPISLSPLSDLKLPEDKMAELKAGKIIAVDHDSLDWRFYAELTGSSYALQVGPFDYPFSSGMFLNTIFALFGMSLALALFLWVRPLWKSIKTLRQTADDFGQGKLASRADIKPRAALGGLAHQFNAMAERISNLIIGHRDLTNAVSHELRTPLARMRFGLDMLENTDAKQDKDKHSRYLAGLHTDIDDLESLVNELLHYARFERNEALPDVEEIQLIPWLEAIIDNARGYAGNLTLLCIKNDIPTNRTFHGAPRHLARVIHNLLRNAVRYSQQNIHIQLEQDTRHIIIHIDDDGIGIPSTDRTRIFDAFTRLDDSRSRQSGGHGLGLAIAKRIVEAHSGTLTIAISPLGGARFTVVLPA